MSSTFQLPLQFHPPFTKLDALKKQYDEDTDSPIGEVFSCTIEIAIKAIEDALKDLNLFDKATVFEESQLYN